jgi:membrane protease YdiL (CAAX protease family)
MRFIWQHERDPATGWEVRWRARNAWQCVLALILLELLITVWIRIAQHSPAPSNWLMAHEHSVQLAMRVFRAGLWLSVAYWFSGARSIRAFADSVALRRPTLVGWLGAWVAIAIAFLDQYGVAKGWTPSNPVVQRAYDAGGQHLFIFVVLVVSVGPFFEEVVLRGFLYSAFRQSYGRLLSTAIVLGVATFFHWGAMVHSVWTPLCLLLLWLFLCALREGTRNVWNCVLCHSVYNAAQTVPWLYYVLGLLLLLPYCARGNNVRGTATGT